jgi:predicted phage tail protein
MDEVRTIRLYGKLGAQFGRIHRLAVASTAEAVRALSVLLPGFEREMMTSRERGVRYACFLGKENIGADQLHLAGGGDIRIAPVLAGAKAGVLQTIIGATLVAAGVALGVYGVLTGNPLLATIGESIANAGLVITLGGVIQMLSPQQSGTAAADGAANSASYNFNGPVNTTAQGNPVPLLYGRMIVGSAVISAGILSQDEAYAGAQLAGAALPKIRNKYPEYDE